MLFPSEVRDLAGRTAGLRLLLLHGSRARGEAHAGSDWDFGFIADGACDVPRLHAALASALGTDDVDLVDLERASGLLRQRVARDGTLVFERESGPRERFVIDAVTFWIDAGQTIREAQEAVLERLG